MSSQAQTAQDETSIIFKLQDAVGYVLNAAPTELSGLGEYDYRVLLQNICARARKEQPDAIEAAHRLLYHIPYPDDVEMADLNAAMEFTDAWRRYARTWEPISSQKKKPAMEIYRESSLIALETLGLTDQIKEITFEKCAFEEGETNTPPLLKRDFTGMASAQTQYDQDGFRAILRANSAMPLWDGEYEPACRKSREIARFAFHEVSHVDQAVKQKSISSGAFYRLMNYQSTVMHGLKGIFSIYRCSFEERQSYLRDRYVEACLENGKLCSERAIMDKHLYEEAMYPTVQRGIDILLGNIESGKLDHLLPSHQAAQNKEKGSLLDL